MESQRVKKAKRFLEDALLFFKHGRYESCISRCYYALFHLCIAFLESYGLHQKEWKHSFVLSELHKEFVHKRKILARETAKSITEIFDERNKADYEVEEKTLKKAKRILDKTQAIFYTLLKNAKNEK